MKIYVASSWRNNIHPFVVRCLRGQGHEVYDFKNPPEGTGFSWNEIGENPEKWTTAEFIQVLSHEISERAFMSDFNAMQWCDCLVMVGPCGSSAHLELGWAAGAKKLTAVFLPDMREPELMVKVADYITNDISDLIAFCSQD